MRTRHYWRQLSALIKDTLRHRARSPQGSEHNRDIDESVARRSETDASRDSLKLQALEGLCRQLDATRNTDRDKLDTLQREIGVLRGEGRSALEQVGRLDGDLQDARQQLASSRRQVAELRGVLDVQTREFEVYRSGTSRALEIVQNRVGELVDKLELQQRLGQETSAELRKQAQRLGWTGMLAAMAIVIATLAGGILVWEAQKNARLLTDMNEGMKQLLATMNHHIDSAHRDAA